jgi:hypothetical protein
MSAGLVALCGLIYAWVMVLEALKGQWANSLIYLGYTIANCGAVMIVYKGIKP